MDIKQEQVRKLKCFNIKLQSEFILECLEYGKYVFTEYLSVDPLSSKLVTRDECGHTVVKLIVGGTKAGAKEFPHMVIIFCLKNTS